MEQLAVSDIMRSPRATITDNLQTRSVEEWSTTVIRDEQLSDDDRKILRGLADHGTARIKLYELRTGTEVRTQSWVGVIRLSQIELRIVPKLAEDYIDVVRMLEATRGIDAIKPIPHLDVDALGVDKSTNLLELLALLFAGECERIVSAGVLHDYLTMEDDLPVLRGRLMIDRQIRCRMGMIARLECQFDEHSSDVADNQLLATALDICSRRVRHARVVPRVNQLREIFRDVCSLPVGDIEYLRTSITYNRMNRHYRNAHELAWWILEAAGIDDLLVSRPLRSFAFLIDMNRLFEEFVTAVVRRILPPEVYFVHDQRSDRSILWSDKEPFAAVRPDLLIEPKDREESGSWKLAVEAKYKKYDEKKPSPSDIYQSFLYAFAYNDPVYPCGLILYPMSSLTSNPVRIDLQRKSSSMTASVHVMGVHIRTLLSELEQGSGAVMGEIRLAIEKILGRV